MFAWLELKKIRGHPQKFGRAGVGGVLSDVTHLLKCEETLHCTLDQLS